MRRGLRSQTSNTNSGPNVMTSTNRASSNPNIVTRLAGMRGLGGEKVAVQARLQYKKTYRLRTSPLFVITAGDRASNRFPLDSKKKRALGWTAGGENIGSIRAVPLDLALSSRTKKQPSARTLRTRALEKDAEEVVKAIKERGAAQIDFAAEEESPDRYLSGLRSALTRKGHRGILLQKKRGAAQAVAWEMRDEDKSRVEKRRQTGARLGQVAKARAGQRRRRS